MRGKSSVLLLAVISVFCMSDYALAEVIASEGGDRNGVRLDASKRNADGAGVIITLTLTCSKNWGGNASGAAFVQAVGTKTQNYQEKVIKCSANGGADGAGKNDIQRQGLYFAGDEKVIIIPSLKFQSRSNWQEWQASIENVVKAQVKTMIDSTNPANLLEAAKSAGFKAVEM